MVRFLRVTLLLGLGWFRLSPAVNSSASGQTAVASPSAVAAPSAAGAPSPSAASPPPSPLGEALTLYRKGQISGDPTFGPFAGVLGKAALPMQIPEGVGIEIPRRGQLSCRAGENQCRFKILRSEEALELATEEAIAAAPKSTE